MALGRKTGGRTSGTPNRKTRDVVELLRSLKCDPIEGMVRIAQDVKNTPELRGKMYAHLAEYVYAKRRAVEVSGEEGATQVIVSWGLAPTVDAP